MKKLEFFKDVKAIHEEKAKLNELKTKVDILYQFLKGKDYKPTFKTVIELIKSILQNIAKLGEFIATDYYLRLFILENNKTNYKNFGFQVNKAKLVELIDLPEPEVKQVIEVLNFVFISDIPLLDGLTLNTENDIIELAQGHEKEIEKRHTYYAVGKQQIEAATAMLNLVDSLNTYKEKCEIDLFQKVEGVTHNDEAYLIDSWYLRNLIAHMQNRAK